MKIIPIRETVLYTNKALKYFVTCLRAAPGPFWVIILWAVLYLPNANLRSLYYEEGRRALMALEVLENGNWLQPRVLGNPYVSKPPLLPWLIAIVGWLKGGIDEWSVRLPALAMTLLSAFLVYNLTLRYTRWDFALLASAAFLVSPLLMERARLGETDTTVMTVSFAAFVTWWNGYRKSSLGLLRWIACGFLLCLVSLSKGPVPLAYFGIGVFLFNVLKRRWRDMIGLCLAMLIPLAAVGIWSWAVYEPGYTEIWKHQMRLAAHFGSIWNYAFGRFYDAVETIGAMLPWIVFTIPALIPAWRQRLNIDKNFANALLFYAAGFTIIVILWPRSRPRYALPAIPAVAVMAALAAKHLWHRLGIRRAVIAVIVLLMGYQLVFNFVVLPMRASYYQLNRTAGKSIGRIIEGDPAPVYLLSHSGHHNIMFYVGRSVHRIDLAEVADVKPPAWIITTKKYLLDLKFTHFEGMIIAQVEGSKGRRFILIHMDKTFPRKGLQTLSHQSSQRIHLKQKDELKEVKSNPRPPQ